MKPGLNGSTVAHLLLTILLLLVLALPAYAQSGGPYDLSWSTIDGGGETSTGGPFSLSGTIGQPDANLLTGGNYTLGGGFWGGGRVAIETYIYLPVVLRNH